MGCDSNLRALQASEEDPERDDRRESARRGHRRAMRHMSAEARKRYANSMDTDEERDMVGAISAELDDEDRERDAQRKGSDGEDKEEKDDGLESRIASMMAKFTDEMKANFDIKVDKFTKDVTPRVAHSVAHISQRLADNGMSPKAFQAAVGSHGIEYAIQKHVPPGLLDEPRTGDVPALQASAPRGGAAFRSMKGMLGGAA